MHHVSWDKIKERLVQSERQDREFREKVKTIFAKIVQHHAVPDFSHTPRVVVFTASNKSLAQELFFQKATLEEELQREVVIH